MYPIGSTNGSASQEVTDALKLLKHHSKWARKADSFALCQSILAGVNGWIVKLELGDTSSFQQTIRANGLSVRTTNSHKNQAIKYLALAITDKKLLNSEPSKEVLDDPLLKPKAIKQYLLDNKISSRAKLHEAVVAVFGIQNEKIIREKGYAKGEEAQLEDTIGSIDGKNFACNETDVIERVSNALGLLSTFDEEAKKRIIKFLEGELFKLQSTAGNAHLNDPSGFVLDPPSTSCEEPCAAPPHDAEDRQDSDSLALLMPPHLAEIGDF